MIQLGGKASNLTEARKLYREAISSGKAFEQMKKIAQAQGCAPDVFENFEQKVQPKNRTALKANRSGYLSRIHAQPIGWGLVDLGAGRKQAKDPVDSTAGIYFLIHEGDEVKTGDTLAEVVWSNLPDATEPLTRLREAFVISDAPVSLRPLVSFRQDRDGFSKVDNFEQLFTDK